jgi:hypothetical protein
MSNPNKFKESDVVMLLSEKHKQNPVTMTIEGRLKTAYPPTNKVEQIAILHPNCSTDELYLCSWFESNKKFNSEVFAASLITPFPDRDGATLDGAS